MSVRSVFSCRAVIQPATPADRTSRRSSSVVRARACVRACVQAWRNALRVAIARAWVCVRAFVRALRSALRVAAASSKEKQPAKKEGKRVGTLNKKGALRTCCEAEKAEGGESGVRAVA